MYLQDTEGQPREAPESGQSLEAEQAVAEVQIQGPEVELPDQPQERDLTPGLEQNTPVPFSSLSLE